MYGSEPSYSPYTQSPSPAGYGNPMTPGSIAPVSPAFNPLTPGTGMEETHAGGDWVTTDIEVRINENHEVSLVILTIEAQVTQAPGHLAWVIVSRMLITWRTSVDFTSRYATFIQMAPSISRK